MPLLLEAEQINLQARRFEVPGLPVSNTDGVWYVTSFEGWDNATKPDAVLVANGGGPGTVAAGLWQSAEWYGAMSGVIEGPPDVQTAFRSALLTGVPTDTDVSVIGYGVGEVDMQRFARRYDAAEFIRRPEWMRFTLPLVAGDPFKYALEPLEATMGVWTGEQWYLALTLAGGRWTMPLTLDSRWGLELEQTAPSGPYPESVTLTSEGDATSQRVTFDITGPLIAGDWWLEEELTGNRLWIEAGVATGQSAQLDCAARSATVGGVDATHLVFGDWFTLQPGANTYRLVGGTASDGFATVTALPAYQ